MKLRYIKPERITFSRPTIYFSKKGHVSINAGAVRALNLDHHHFIQFFQDEEHPRDWYVKFNKENEGFPLRKTKNIKSLSFHSSDLSRKVMHSLGFYAHVTMLIGTKPIDEEKHYQLITKSAAGT